MLSNEVHDDSDIVMSDNFWCLLNDFDEQKRYIQQGTTEDNADDNIVIAFDGQIFCNVQADIDIVTVSLFVLRTCKVTMRRADLSK